MEMRQTWERALQARQHLYIKEMNLVQRMSIFTRKTNKADNR